MKTATKLRGRAAVAATGNDININNDTESERDDDTPRYTAPALEKGLDILDVLVDTTDGYTLNELSLKLGRTVSEIFRMVVTLERRGYVQGDHNDRYTLTLKLFEMAHRQQPIRSLTAVALPLLRELANVTRQSCHLSIYHSGRVAVIAQIDSPERWSFGLKVGAVMGLTDTSSGHVLLAFRDEAERERMLASHSRVEGENEVEREQLKRLLDEVRATGHEIVPRRTTRTAAGTRSTAETTTTRPENATSSMRGSIGSPARA